MIGGMTNNGRLRLIFHGAVVLLVGLLCGLPTVIESSTESVRFWHTAHEALIMMGIWILATSSVVPALVLERREAAGLVWSLLAMGYGFMTALVIGGVIGVSPFEPGHTPAAFTAFLGSTVGILGAVMATALTLMGARAALKSAPPDR
jgi:hypothetical protein